MSWSHVYRWRAEANEMDAKASHYITLSHIEDDPVQSIGMRHEAARLREQATRRREWADNFVRSGILPVVREVTA